MVLRRGLLGLLFWTAFAAVACSKSNTNGDVTDGLIGWWDFEDSSTTVARDESSFKNDGVVTQGSKAAEKVDLGVEGEHAIKFEGGTKSQVSIPHHDHYNVESATFSCWWNWWWGPARGPFMEKKNMFKLRIYRQYVQITLNDFSDGSHEDVLIDLYPSSNGWVDSGFWYHIAVTYDMKSKTASVYLNGQVIQSVSTRGAPLRPTWEKDISKSDLDSGKYNIYLGGVAHNEYYAGYGDDFRMYGRVLSSDEIAQVYNHKKNLYNATKLQEPTAEEIAAAGRGWHDRAVTAEDTAMHQAWLNYKTISPEYADKHAHLLRRVVVHTDDNDDSISNAPILTAASELSKAISVFFDHPVERIQNTDATSGDVILTTTTSAFGVLQRLGADGDDLGEEGYKISLRPCGKDQDELCLHIASDGERGCLHGVWALIRALQTNDALPTALVSGNEEVVIEQSKPSTDVRIINHWTFWRGFRSDAWMKKTNSTFNSEGNRDDSIFSWNDFKPNADPSSPGRQRVEMWAKLLSSAGINAIAPCDVNWDNRNNFLEHLDEVADFASLLRNWGIKLYWSPNYELAADRETADLLYSAVPDFGGYLLKLGSEAQAGDPGPKTVNRIARGLSRKGREGKVLLRAFVYGKQYDDNPRIVIPKIFFEPFDGQYESNVAVIGKFSPIDFETAEPINPLDGIMQKTTYGMEVMAAKSFMMSWLGRWQEWLDFDTWRGPPDSQGHETSLVNRDTVSVVLAVSMMAPVPSWTSNPLNMVNYYGIGRLGWDVTRRRSDIYAEWAQRTFGGDVDVDTIKQLLSFSETSANNLCLYHGYRGVWFKSSGSSLEENPLEDMEVSSKRIGAPGIENGVLKHYSKTVGQIYGNFTDPRSEKVLLEWQKFDYDYKLTSGRTIFEDICSSLSEGKDEADRMADLWNGLNSSIDAKMKETVAANLDNYVHTADKQQKSIAKAFKNLLGESCSDQDKNHNVRTSSQ